MNGCGQAKNIVEINEVEKAYQVGDNQVPVLTGLSLSVEPGEFVAINRSRPSPARPLAPI